MAKGILLVVFLAVAIAQALPSCGGEPRTITGWVEAKYYHGRRESYVIVINGIEYSVDDPFYFTVEVGDLVRRDPDGLWRIVKKKGT